MGNFFPVKKLRKEPFIPSCDITFAQHCAMDVALEELFELSDVNALVVGVGECVYYSRKIPFSEPKRNWAFSLTDNEIVFGDTSEIDNALRGITDNGLTTVIIATCVPSIMNLDLESIAAEHENTVLLKAPDFSGISPYDIIGELYVVLAKGANAGIKHGIERWKGGMGSVEEFRNKLQADTHIVSDRRYLPVLTAFAEKQVIKVVDDTALHTLDFYSENSKLLGINSDDIKRAKSTLEKLRDKSSLISIKCLRGADAALFFQNEGFDIGSVVFGGYNDYTYNICSNLKGASVSPDYRDGLSGEGLLLDLSAFDPEIAERVGFDRLKFILEKAEELCL